MRILATAVLLLLTLELSAQADDHRSDRKVKRSFHSENYILRRQQAYQVQGVPTSRLIIGKREIDVYRSGVMFEKDNVVGVSKR